MQALFQGTTNANYDQRKDEYRLLAIENLAELERIQGKYVSKLRIAHSGT